mmetsp:Transcript_8468/g.12504  ORF Transcript_8468/g.12504 Transcript_8468/m.12504 type:complete len:138 (+) Transcript_8468:32-445(+)
MKRSFLKSSTFLGKYTSPMVSTLHTTPIHIQHHAIATYVTQPTIKCVIEGETKKKSIAAHKHFLFGQKTINVKELKAPNKKLKFKVKHYRNYFPADCGKYDETGIQMSEREAQRKKRATFLRATGRNGKKEKKITRR